MKNTRQPPPGQHPITYDQPLPGHYPVLTLQLNVTRYQSQQVGKMVLVVREPQAQLEVFRSFIELGPWSSVDTSLEAHVESALRRLVYLQEGESPTGL